jgi:hypothetical protein
VSGSRFLYVTQGELISEMDPCASTQIADSVRADFVCSSPMVRLRSADSALWLAGLQPGTVWAMTRSRGCRLRGPRQRTHKPVTRRLAGPGGMARTELAVAMIWCWRPVAAGPGEQD